MKELIKAILPNWVMVLKRKLHLWFIKFINRGKIKVDFKGSSFCVPITEYSDYAYTKRFATFEPEFLTEFVDNVSQCKVFYDVGSFTSLYSILAKNCNPDIKLVLVEADKDNAEKIMSNLSYNQITDYNLCNVAVGDEDGEISFTSEEGSIGHIKRDKENSTQFNTIKLRKLDTLIKEEKLPKPDIVKMDIEGYEANAIRGFVETLKDSQPIVLMEVHPKFLASYNESEKEIDNTFKELGYFKKTLHFPNTNAGTVHTQKHVAFYPKEKFLNNIAEGSKNCQNGLVSVVIPTYNRSDLLSRSLDTILKQTYTNLEVIIVDDNSTDDTSDVVDQYIQRDDRIKYLKNDENKGGGFSRNRGLQNANGEYIAFLDDDDEWYPSKLEEQLIYTDDFSMVGCLSSIDDPTLVNNCSEIITLEDVFYNNGLLSPTVILARKDYLEEINGFDETLTGAQGRDLFVRMVERFGPAVRVNKLLSIHHQDHGKHRISENSTHLQGYWKEFNKHQHLMPTDLRKFRKFNLITKEAIKEKSFFKLLSSIKYLSNAHTYASFKILVRSFFTIFK